jgi:type II secretory pathway pseudopilin PulG
MPFDPVNVVVLLVSVGAAFFVSRWLASRRRQRDREREEKTARAGESRQARRARERRARD